MHLPWLDPTSIVSWNKLEGQIGAGQNRHIGLASAKGRKLKELLDRDLESTVPLSRLYKGIQILHRIRSVPDCRV